MRDLTLEILWSVLLEVCPEIYINAGELEILRAFIWSTAILVWVMRLLVDWG